MARLHLRAFKVFHGRSRTRETPLVERYVDISGRVSALWIGTFAVQMILSGVKDWMA